MKSSFYTGYVRHRRFSEKAHAFRYGLFMMHLYLDELDEVFRGRVLWSSKRPAFAWFRRADYLGDPGVPLEESVRRLVEVHTGRTAEGRISLLTQLRYAGVLMNPVSFYFCWDAEGRRPEAVVLEVTNTPWGERHCYVLEGGSPDGGAIRATFAKDFHVSPFLPMAMEYRLRMNVPGRQVGIHLENWSGGQKCFDATLALQHCALTGINAAKMLTGHPWMSLQVLAAIYFEAFRLWRKGVKIHGHPQRLTQEEIEEA